MSKLWNTDPVLAKVVRSLVVSEGYNCVRALVSLFYKHIDYPDNTISQAAALKLLLDTEPSLTPYEQRYILQAFAVPLSRKWPHLSGEIVRFDVPAFTAAYRSGMNAVRKAAVDEAFCAFSQHPEGPLSPRAFASARTLRKAFEPAHHPLVEAGAVSADSVRDAFHSAFSQSSFYRPFVDGQLDADPPFDGDNISREEFAAYWSGASAAIPIDSHFVKTVLMCLGVEDATASDAALVRPSSPRTYIQNYSAANLSATEVFQKKAYSAASTAKGARVEGAVDASHHPYARPAPRMSDIYAHSVSTRSQQYDASALKPRPLQPALPSDPRYHASTLPPVPTSRSAAATAWAAPNTAEAAPLPRNRRGFEVAGQGGIHTTWVDHVDRSGVRALTHLRERVAERVGSVQGVRLMRRALQSVDVDSDGLVSIAEGTRALSVIGARVQPDVLREFFSAHGADDDGRIPLRAFVEVLRGDCPNDAFGSIVSAWDRVAGGGGDGDGGGAVSLGRLVEVVRLDRHPEVLAGRSRPFEVLRGLVQSLSQDSKAATMTGTIPTAVRAGEEMMVTPWGRIRVPTAVVDFKTFAEWLWDVAAGTPSTPVFCDMVREMFP